MANTVNNLPVFFKKIALDKPSNFLVFLKKLHETKPIEAEEKEIIKCDSPYLETLKKMQNNPFVSS